jgi:hypothetical protein
MYLSFDAIAQNFTLDDPDDLFTKKEKTVFETAVNYEAAFYNRIFTEKNIDFSQIKFTVTSSYLQYMYYLSQAGGAVHQNSAGVYFPAKQELVVCKDKKYKDTFLKTCFHEMSHAFLHLHTGEKSIPAWLNEGLAEYLEQMTFSSKKINQQISAYHLARVKTLIEIKEINLSEFVNWHYDKFSAASFTQEGYGYTIGYCMVLFMMQKDENQAITIIQNLAGSTSSIDVFDKYYEGGFAQFEKDFIAEFE